MTREERHIAVLNRMLENMDVYDSIQPTQERKKAIKAAIKALKQEPCDKSGKWEYVPQDKGWYICSECGCGNEYADKFCPQCGAKMVEPQESEDK